MTTSDGAARSRAAARVRLATSALLAAALLVTVDHPARGNPGTAVEALRATFNAAYDQEAKGHHAEALALFQAVKRERDTASVRYRIAACLEGLGRRVEARAAYAQVAEVARPSDAAVVESAATRAAALAARLSELSVQVEAGDRGEGTLAVTIDGVAIPLVDGRASRTLEPGPHEVAFARGGEPVPVTVTLVGGRSAVVILSVVGASVNHQTQANPPSRAPRPEPTSDRAYGALGIGLGAALLSGAAVALVVRERAISAVEEACPGGVCPRSSAESVDGAAARARAMVPVSLLCASVGAAALGAGAWLLLRPSHSPDGRLSGLAATVGGQF